MLPDRRSADRTWRGCSAAWRSAGPAYVALARALRLLVLDGRLPLRTRLPGRARAGRGAGREPHDRDRGLRRAARRGLPRQPPRRGQLDAAARRSGRRRAAPAPSGEDVIDLSCAASAAPEGALHAALAAATAELPRHLPGPGYDAAGCRSLRAAIAAHFTRRGAPTTPEQILVTAGALHAVSAAPARARRPGRSRAGRRTRPTPPRSTPSAPRRAARAGAAVPDGWDMDMLEATLRQAAPRLAYLIPDHHNPTGLSLPEADRERLVALARATRTPLVIDEAIAELHLDGDPPPVAGRRARPGGRDRDHDRLDEQGVLGRAADRLDPRAARARRPARRRPRQRSTSASPVIEQLDRRRAARGRRRRSSPRQRELFRARRDALAAALRALPSGASRSRPAASACGSSSTRPAAPRWPRSPTATACASPPGRASASTARSSASSACPTRCQSRSLEDGRRAAGGRLARGQRGPPAAPSPVALVA